MSLNICKHTQLILFPKYDILLQLCYLMSVVDNNIVMQGAQEDGTKSTFLRAEIQCEKLKAEYVKVNILY